MSDKVTDTPEALAWEADNRFRTGAFAALSAVLTLVGGILLVVSTAPDFQDRIVTVLEALQDNADGRGDVVGAAGSRLAYLADHPVSSLAPAVVSGVGALLMFPVLAYLFRATRARRPMRQGALIAAAVGAVAFGVGTIVTFALYYGVVGDVPADDRSNSAFADAVTDSGSISAAGTIRALGALALGGATIIIALNAMRVGLLSRFLGVLGIIVGASLLLTGTPLPLDQQGLIRTFWLAALALMLMGRLPGGLPKAWETGQAEPWPSNRPVVAAQPAKKRKDDGPDVPVPTPRASHSSSKKRRKRRR